MSVYIPGMETPKACIACPFAQYWSEPTKFADDELFEKVWIICGRTRSKIQSGTNRNDDCPLVHVPPHGRLIDADAFMELMFADPYQDFVHIIEQMPAIIPADREEVEG